MLNKKSGKKVQFRKLINNEDIQALASKEEE